MAKKKTSADLRAENKMLRQMNYSMTIGSIVNNFIRWGGVCFIAWMAFRVVDCLAGRSTDANIVLRLLADLRVNTALAYLLGAGGMVYGAFQRKLKKRTIGRLQGKIRDYESSVDPGRTSSELTEQGETNPRDQF